MDRNGPKDWYQLVIDDEKKEYVVLGPYTQNTIRIEEKLLREIEDLMSNGRNLNVQPMLSRSSANLSKYVTKLGLEEVARTEILPELN